MLEGSTTSKTTLWTSLVLIWLDDSPYSNQSLDMRIGPTTDHTDQSMKISSIFNTRKYIPWNELSWQAFIFQLSKLLFSLTNQLRVIQHGFLEKGWFTRNQLVHELNISSGTTWWYFQEDIWKITIHRHVIKIENNLAFQARWYDRISKDGHYPNSLIEKCTGNKD